MSDIAAKVRRVNVFYLILILFYIGASLGLGLFGLPAFLPENLVMIMGEVLIGLPAFIYCLVLQEKPFGGRFRAKLRLPVLLLLILLGLFSMPLAWFINSITMLFTPNEVAGVVVEAQANPLWLNLILIAVIPAVVEELVFRGIFYGTYSRMNPVRGMLLSGLLFGVMHLNLNQIAYAVPLGILLAAVLEMTGSFLAPMAVHFTINGFNTALAWLAMRFLSGGGWEEALPEAEAAAEIGIPVAFYIVLFALAAISLAAVIGLLIAISNLSRRKNWRKALFGGRAPVLLAVDGVPVKRRLGDVFLWIGIGIAVVYAVI